MSRRDLLRSGAIVGVAAIGSTFGRGDLFADQDTAALGRTRSVPRRGGTFRLGYGGPTSSETLYPLTPFTVADVARAAALYDRLFVRQNDFSIQDELAEEMEPGDDGLSYVIRVRSGVEFHNGKTLNADDLIFSFREWLDPERSGAARGLSAIDGDSIESLDDRTIRLHLSQPDYLIKENLIRYGTIVVPSDFDPTDPVGCGPYKPSTFDPGRSSTFVRHENYWQTDRPYFDEVVMTGFTEEVTRLNAMLSGQIDAMPQLSASQVAQVSGNSGIALLETDGGTVQPSMFAMNVQHAPFDDPLVRAALRLAVDRQQLVDQVFGGRGRVGNDMWAPPDPHYADHVPTRERDVDQARSLLEQAGQTNLNLEFTVAEYDAAVIPSAEVFAQQAVEAGINISLKKITVNEWFEGNTKFPFVFDYWAAGSVPQQATFLLPGDIYDSTHWSDLVPEYAEAYEAAKREPDDAQRTELLQHCQELHHESGAMIMWGFPNGIDAVSDELGGLVASDSGLSLNGYLAFKEAYFVA